MVAFAKICGDLQFKMDQKGEHTKMIFDYFQIQKWMSQTDWKKQMEKLGQLSSFYVSFLSFGP